MRIRYAKRKIPTAFHPMVKGLAAEADLFIFKRARLAAKLLIFKTPAAMRRFWRQISPCDLGRDCLGAVNALAREVIKFDGKGRELPKLLEVDPKYFCLVALVVGHLTVEIITHESAHVGFCYAKRRRRRIFADAGDSDEEEICYPAGRIANEIVAFATRRGFIPAKKPTSCKADRRKLS